MSFVTPPGFVLVFFRSLVRPMPFHEARAGPPMRVYFYFRFPYNHDVLLYPWTKFLLQMRLVLVIGQRLTTTDLHDTKNQLHSCMSIGG